MAKNIVNDIFGFSGTLGNVIGYKWRGIQCYRSKPFQQKDPKTPKQVSQRIRFTAFQPLAKKCLNKTLKEIWKRCAVEMTGYNLFIKKNMRITDELGKITDYSNLTLSVGKLELPYEFKIETKVEGNCLVTISWENEGREKIATLKNRIQVAAIINSEVIHVEGLTACRGDKTVTFQLPCGRGARIHLYVYFYNESTMDGSPSYYQLVEVPN
jgi:hypothetical protein